jgi:NAD(P)-dependent dehydrogenase (short-subunit alcohol dehydrogenase family)
MSQAMKGKVVVITGATSGIGEVAARELADMGARIVLVARDTRRGEAVLAQLRGIDASAPHSIHYGDLSRLSEMKRLGVQIAAAEPRIDVLINNAGALFDSRQLTEDQWERTFATNHMARSAEPISTAHPPLLRRRRGMTLPRRGFGRTLRSLRVLRREARAQR